MTADNIVLQLADARLAERALRHYSAEASAAVLQNRDDRTAIAMWASEAAQARALAEYIKARTL